MSDERNTDAAGTPGEQPELTADCAVDLATLKPGDAARVLDVSGEGAFRRRLLDMGFTKGAFVRVIKHAPFGDPIEYCIGGTHVTLREQEARQIIVEQVAPPPPCRARRRGGRTRGGGRGPGHRRLWRRKSR